MKRNLLVATLILGTMVFTSCKEDEPKINPIVGDWELDDVEREAADANFSSYDVVRSNFIGETKYTFEFNADNTYERELDGFTTRVKDEGEWEIKEDELELDPDDGTFSQDLFTDFEIVEISQDDLVLKVEIDGFRLIPNSARPDTLTSAESEQALLDDHGVANQTIIFTLNFERD